MATQETPSFDFDDLKQEVVNRLIFQPIGLLAAVVRTLPNAAEEGRRVVEGPLQTAKFVGDMAAGVMKAKYGAQISDLEGKVSDVRRTVEGAADLVIKTVQSRVGGFGAESQPRTTDDGGAGEATVHEAEGSETVGGIVGYESMTAAEVISHLDGLTLSELGEVEAFELEHRRRRTVLGRVSKLREDHH
ncbi:hypothetical protein [Ferrimicrobium acidiphilum]|uniref:hypothetical protein n=1 Tax=Ferrimicrobium acidiphilum TaxID=121039 RepID=UPI0023F36E9C|nr:hypothetical protein [Ferrimicrobium acidiphilum]